MVILMVPAPPPEALGETTETPSKHVSMRHAVRLKLGFLLLASPFIAISHLLFYYTALHYIICTVILGARYSHFSLAALVVTTFSTRTFDHAANYILATLGDGLPRHTRSMHRLMYYQASFGSKSITCCDHDVAIQYGSMMREPPGHQFKSFPSLQNLESSMLLSIEALAASSTYL